ncbi:hypothetical protein BB021_18170 [Elizabethkingia ursingii]|uniref:Uncharacterized protein n=1 Tax=Elizabethkingia ursingii TaxID=1756150 RepID=A0ABX3NDS1_9FLAO|nr:hypothetical protein BB021_18170 [Elizabethkingia ursingii]
MLGLMIFAEQFPSFLFSAFVGGPLIGIIGLKSFMSHRWLHWRNQFSNRVPICIANTGIECDTRHHQRL